MDNKTKYIKYKNINLKGNSDDKVYMNKDDIQLIKSRIQYVTHATDQFGFNGIFE